MTFYKSLSVLATAVLLSACGGSSSDENTPQTAKVSFSVSDAPVDSASEVVVAFDKIELKHENGKSYIIDVDTDDQGNDYQQIDLLDYQGTDAALIITEEEIPVGSYKEMIIHTKSGNMNWVEDNGTHNLKIPSNKLKLGGFEVDTETVQSFTIEFDLRKSLVLRGNGNNNNGYNLKPHGITIIDNSAAASLWGNVDPALFSAGIDCDANSGNFVYLYEDHGHDGEPLIDNVDIHDPDYDQDTVLPENAVFPYASVSVDDNGDYAFGYIPAGNYTVAFTCNAVLDNPIQYDGEIQIANPENQRFEIILDKMQEKIFNFKEII
ncbi:DUF4382 domain-containing protein [Photobacterium makurazakiensis]|uniref:DUF4382 domain-containing protein n=1 Tax=Photobacterium makurazakiensis TaxID=2910234 RepID=UPI003D11D4C5